MQSVLSYNPHQYRPTTTNMTMAAPSFPDPRFVLGDGGAGLGDLFDRIREGLERSERRNSGSNGFGSSTANKPKVDPRERNRFSNQFDSARSEARRLSSMHKKQSSPSKPSSSVDASGGIGGFLFGSQIRDDLLNTSYVPPKPEPVAPTPLNFNAPTFSLVSRGSSCSPVVKERPLTSLADILGGSSSESPWPEEVGSDTFFFGQSSRQDSQIDSTAAGSRSIEDSVATAIKSPQEHGLLSPGAQVTHTSPSDAASHCSSRSHEDREGFLQTRRITGESTATSLSNPGLASPLLLERSTSPSVKRSRSQENGLYQHMPSENGLYQQQQQGTAAAAATVTAMAARSLPYSPAGSPAPYVDTTVLLRDASDDGDSHACLRRKVEAPPQRRRPSRTTISLGSRSTASSLRSNNTLSSTGSIGVSSSFLLSSFKNTNQMELSSSFLMNSFVGNGSSSELALMSSVLEDATGGRDSGSDPESRVSPSMNDRKRPSSDALDRAPSPVGASELAPGCEGGWDDGDVDDLAAFAQSLVAPDPKRRRTEEPGSGEERKRAPWHRHLPRAA